MNARTNESRAFVVIIQYQRLQDGNVLLLSLFINDIVSSVF